MSKRCDYLVSVQCGVVYYFLGGLSIDKNHDFCPTKITWGRQTDLSQRWAAASKIQNAKYDIQVCQPPEFKGILVLNANCNQTKKQEPRHYGSKQGEIETFDYKLSHKLGSEQSERASK